MPYIITRINGKDSGMFKRMTLTKTELNRLRGDGNCYTIISPATHRVSKFGNGCKRETPEDQWDGSRRGLRGPFDFITKHFKKTPKRHPMARRIYLIKTKSGTYVPAGVASMQGARRRRRRRRR